MRLSRKSVMYLKNKKMRIEYDKEANAAYIYLKEIGEGEVASTISLSDSVNVDLDKDGKTIGIEILDASKHAPKEFLEQAKIIS
jgi:uncharacterized protein YuzE